MTGQRSNQLNCVPARAVSAEVKNPSLNISLQLSQERFLPRCQQGLSVRFP